jgi:hypothetical protein
MKNLNISNYALMLENNAFVVEATPQEVSKQITKQVAKSLIKPDAKDSEAVKSIKSIISDSTKNKTQYDSIINQIEPFIFNKSEAVKSTELNFKSVDGKTSYTVVVNREKDPNGNYAVWFDEDGTKVFLAGLDINYLATQFNKSIDAGLFAGTDEDLFSSVAGAIHKASFGAGANPQQVFKAVAERYKTAFGEDFYEAVDGEFTGSPDVFARALVGVNITDGDISKALGVDFLQSLVLDVAIGIATFGAGAAVKGLMTGARAVRAAGAVNKIKGGMTAFKSGLAGQKTGVGIAGAANVASLARGAKDANLAKSGFSAITAAGNSARAAGVVGAGVGAGSTIAGGPYSGADQVDSNITADDAAFAFASQLRELAKGYTDGGAELQIAFMILSLNPQSAQLVLAQWNKNFGDEGTFYDYCISEELSGDLKSLVDGYWAGIANGGPLVQKVASIVGNMKSGSPEE